jgi:hypothetical protein
VNKRDLVVAAPLILKDSEKAVADESALFEPSKVF